MPRGRESFCLFREHFYASRILLPERRVGLGGLGMSCMTEPRDTKPCAEGRRGFIQKLLAGVIGAALGLIPAGAGFKFFLDPLGRKASAAGNAVRVATLEALPADGVPRKFPVLADRVDAWNKFVNVPVGAVYLRRTTDGKLEALNVTCPHAGCFVDFKPDEGKFLCPCHNSLFAMDGKIASPGSPAARPLDSLEVELRNEKEIWVKFQNFEAGKAEKIPVA